MGSAGLSSTTSTPPTYVSRPQSLSPIAPVSPTAGSSGSRESSYANYSYPTHPDAGLLMSPAVPAVPAVPGPSFAIAPIVECDSYDPRLRSSTRSIRQARSDGTGLNYGPRRRSEPAFQHKYETPESVTSVPDLPTSLIPRPVQEIRPLRIKSAAVVDGAGSDMESWAGNAIRGEGWSTYPIVNATGEGWGGDMRTDRERERDRVKRGEAAEGAGLPSWRGLHILGAS